MEQRRKIIDEKDNLSGHSNVQFKERLARKKTEMEIIYKL